MPRKAPTREGSSPGDRTSTPAGVCRTDSCCPDRCGWWWCTREVYPAWCTYPACTALYILPCLPCPYYTHRCRTSYARVCTPPGWSQVLFWAPVRSRTWSSWRPNIPEPARAWRSFRASQRWIKGHSWALRGGTGPGLPKVVLTIPARLIAPKIPGSRVKSGVAGSGQRWSRHAARSPGFLTFVTFVTFRQLGDSVTFAIPSLSRPVQETRNHHFCHIYSLSRTSRQNKSVKGALCTGVESRCAQEYSGLYREGSSVFPEDSGLRKVDESDDSWLPGPGLRTKVTKVSESGGITRAREESHESQNRARAASR